MGMYGGIHDSRVLTDGETLGPFMGINEILGFHVGEKVGLKVVGDKEGKSDGAALLLADLDLEALLSLDFEVRDDELLDFHEDEWFDFKDFDSRDILDVEVDALEVVVADLEPRAELLDFHEDSVGADELLFFDDFELGDKILNVHEDPDGTVGGLLNYHDGLVCVNVLVDFEG